MTKRPSPTLPAGGFDAAAADYLARELERAEQLLAQYGNALVEGIGGLTAPQRKRMGSLMLMQAQCARMTRDTCAKIRTPTEKVPA